MASVSTDFSFDSLIRGHHIYKNIWTPSVGEVLLLVKQEENEHDCFAISVMKDGLLLINNSLALNKKKEF